MTERQLDLIWRFFKNPIICLDGDISGRKAAVRAAERLFPMMKPDLNIYFLKLPENFDPDSFVNEKGKDSFLELAKNKTNIQNFISNGIKNIVWNFGVFSIPLFFVLVPQFLVSIFHVQFLLMLQK